MTLISAATATLPNVTSDERPEPEQADSVNGLTRLVDDRLSTPVACERAPRRRT
jgi:hypothetical protein